MPRSTQSRESGIVAYFRTAPLEVAHVVLSLAREALKERLTRSVEAKERALTAHRKAEKLSVSTSAATVAAPKKRKARKARKPRRTRVQTPAEIEQEVSGTESEV